MSKPQEKHTMSKYSASSKAETPNPIPSDTQNSSISNKAIKPTNKTAARQPKLFFDQFYSPKPVSLEDIPDFPSEMDTKPNIREITKLNNRLVSIWDSPKESQNPERKTDPLNKSMQPASRRNDSQSESNRLINSGNSSDRGRSLTPVKRRNIPRKPGSSIPKDSMSNNSNNKITMSLDERSAITNELSKERTSSAKRDNHSADHRKVNCLSIEARTKRQLFSQPKAHNETENEKSPNGRIQKIENERSLDNSSAIELQNGKSLLENLIESLQQEKDSRKPSNDGEDHLEIQIGQSDIPSSTISTNGNQHAGKKNENNRQKLKPI